MKLRGLAKASARRLLRLMLGLYSPSRVALLQLQLGLSEGLGTPPPKLTWLDRWELRNAEK